MVHTLVFRTLSGFPQAAIVAAIAIPVLTLLISLAHGVYDGRRAPWRHIYALVVHLMTLVVAALGALLVYHIVDGGSLQDDGIPLTAVIIIAVGWLLTLLFVKRAVDFSMIRSVRNPFGLLLAWLLGWTAASVLAYAGIWFIPGPEYATVLTAVVGVFLLARIVTRLVFGVRDSD